MIFLRFINITCKGRPFSGATVVCDFCAHAHQDINNMHGGVTVILTLLKPENRDFKPENQNFKPENGNLKQENRNLESEPKDEQLHVLPHYAPAENSDEYGSIVAQLKKYENGELEILNQFERTLIIRGEKGKTEMVVESDSSEVFGEENVDVGGLAIALPHGSLMFECAKKVNNSRVLISKPLIDVVQCNSKSLD